jgi:hypothetical protein
MLRFSQKGWNNFIIYMVVILIALFVVLPEYLKQSRNAVPATFIAPSQTLLALHFPKHQIERAGPVWRSQPETLSEAELMLLLQHWQQATLPDMSPLTPIKPQLVTEVSVWLSGQPALQQWQLYQTSERYWLKAVDADLWYLLQPQQAELLFPPVLR